MTYHWQNRGLDRYDLKNLICPLVYHKFHYARGWAATKHKIPCGRPQLDRDVGCSVGSRVVAIPRERCDIDYSMCIPHGSHHVRAWWRIKARLALLLLLLDEAYREAMC